MTANPMPHVKMNNTPNSIGSYATSVSEFQPQFSDINTYDYHTVGDLS